MDGFKDTTRMKYMTGGSTKGEAKMGKVMGEFASGKLHSGSKKGPEVKNPKQAVAIAMSEARKAGAKMPMKRNEGGGVFNESGKPATLAEIAAEDRRMANEMNARAAARRPVEGISTRPTDSSGRRASNADLGMTAPAKKPVKKAMGGSAKKGVPAHSDRPMIGRKTGGLMAMPKGKC